MARKRSSNAASTSRCSALTTSPMVLRASGCTLPICFRIAVSSPFLPRILAFSSRNACSVAAASNRPRYVARSMARESSIAGGIAGGSVVLIETDPDRIPAEDENTRSDAQTS
jgi:hypothetical protein